MSDFSSPDFPCRVLLETFKIEGQRPLFKIKKDLFSLVHGIRSAINCPSKVGIVCVHGPSGCGKSTLYDATSQFLSHCNIRNVQLPFDIASADAVLDCLDTIRQERPTLFSNEALSNASMRIIGWKLARVVVRQSELNLSSKFTLQNLLTFAMEHKGSECEVFPKVTLFLLHDLGSLLPTVQKTERADVSVNLTNSLRDSTEIVNLSTASPAEKRQKLDQSAFDPEHHSSIPDDADQFSPSIFSFEQRGSLQAPSFPGVISHSTVKAALNGASESLYIQLMGAFGQELDSLCHSSALISFGSDVQPLLRRSNEDGCISIMSKTSSERGHFNFPLSPALKNTWNEDECFHVFANKCLRNALNEINLSVKALQVLRRQLLGALIVTGQWRLATFWNGINSIVSLDSSAISQSSVDQQVNYVRDVFLQATFYSGLDTFEEDKVEQLLMNCRGANQKNAFVAKLLLAVLSRVSVHILCHPVRDALRYSVCYLAESIAKDTGTRLLMGYSHLDYFFHKLLLPPLPDGEGKELLARCADQLLRLPPQFHSMDAVGLGQAFERCVFAKMVLTTAFLELAFSQIPKNCYTLFDFLNIGSILQLPASATDAAISPQPTPANTDNFLSGNILMEVCAVEDAHSKSLICQMIENFTGFDRKEGTARILLLHTPNLVGVDQIVVCIVPRRTEVILFQCKSSVAVGQKFDQDDLDDILGNSQATCNIIRQAASKSDTVTSLKLSVQLLCRSASSLFQTDSASSQEASSQHRYVLRRKIVPSKPNLPVYISEFLIPGSSAAGSAANSLLCFPGLSTVGSPHIYLPQDCLSAKCKKLRNKFFQSIGPSSHRNATNRIVSVVSRNNK